jgi:ABC-type sugar transport system substrate-binding protein
VLEELERALAPEPAALCVYFGSESLARAAADSLSRYRGVLVTINSAPPGVESFAHVAADWCQGAESLADAINSALEKLDRRSFVLLHADGRSELETNIFRRFRSAMSRFTRVQLLDQAVLGTSIPPRSPAEQVAAMLERFRHAGLAVTLDPAPWIAPALYRLEEPQHFATLGASPALWPRLRSGEAVALVGPHEGELGRIAIERAIRGLTGDSDARGSVLVPCEVVTPDTFEAFRAKYEQFASPARARP